MATFQIQKSSSSVSWTGKKISGLHTGSINIADGFVEIADNRIISGEIQIDMSSIVITDIEDKKTHDDFLAHLKNDDFFAVDKFRISKLIIAGSEKVETNKLKVDGMLTIKSISHPVSFIASVEILTDFLHPLGEIVLIEHCTIFAMAPANFYKTWATI